MLSDTRSPSETLARLSRDLEAAARKFDVLFIEISGELGPDDPLIKEAMAVKQVWLTMSIDVADRVRKQRM